MSRLKSVLNSRGTSILYLVLILTVMVLLGMWQDGERSNREIEYRQFYEEYAYNWYNRLDINLGVLSELFNVPSDLSESEQELLLKKRMKYWDNKSPFPEVLDAVIRVDMSENKSVFTQFDQSRFKLLENDEWRETASSIISNPASSDYGSFAISIENDIPALTLYSEDHDVYTVLILNKEVLINDVFPHITEAVFRDTILPDDIMSPAIVQFGKEEKIIYSLMPRGDIGDNSLPMGPLTVFDSLFMEDSTVTEELKSELKELNIENSYYLNYWQIKGSKELKFEDMTVNSWMENISEDQNVWFFVYLPGRRTLETQVIIEILPYVILGYFSLILLGLALMILTKFNRENLSLLIKQEEFVSTLTHELRTPLHIINNGAGNLVDGVITEKEDIVRYGEMIRKEGLRLTDMIESILSYSGVTQREMQRQFFPLRDVLDEGLHPFRILCKERGISLIEEISTDSEYYGDREAVKLILSNLLSNALTHGAAGKWIRVSATLWEDLVLIVEDKGRGIPKSEIEKIREPFYRGEMTRKEQIHSSGLGLSIVERVIHRERGTLIIQSREDKGSVFTVYLPVSSNEETVNV